MQLERQATQIREYQPLMVPGLLQTEMYARTLLQQGLATDKDQLERLLKVRIDRFSALPHTLLWFVIDEPVVRRVVGPREIMYAQLTKLLETNSSRVRITVIPDHAPERPLVGGSFRIMSLPTGRMVAHAEHLMGEVVIDHPPQVSDMLSYFENLQSEALSPGASADLIQQIRGTLP